MENQRCEALTKTLPRGNSRRGILRTLGVTGLGAGAAFNLQRRGDGAVRGGGLHGVTD